MSETIPFWFDVRSPYSYLAKDLAYALESEFPVTLDLKPVEIDLGGAHGTPETRSAREWAKVKYIYMDVRRLAGARGLTVRGTVKIFDPTLAHLAYLYADSLGRGRAFLDALWPPFWNREVDIEDEAALAPFLDAAGAPAAGFAAYREGDGRARLQALADEAESAGLFGVPTFVFGTEMFWGTDRVPMLRERMAEAFETAV